MAKKIKYPKIVLHLSRDRMVIVAVEQKNITLSALETNEEKELKLLLKKIHDFVGEQMKEHKAIYG